MIIKTHNGIFHADEVIAVAFLQIYYPITKVVRTRDADFVADFVVDVDGKFDGINYFDHHQDNKLPASCNLVWEHIVNKFNVNPIIDSYIKINLLDSTSSLDCNYLEYSKANPVYPYRPISSFISDFNQVSDNQDTDFNSAVNFAKIVIINLILKAEKRIPVINQIKNNKDYVVTEFVSEIPYNEFRTEIKTKFIIYPKTDNTWCAISMGNEFMELDNKPYLFFHKAKFCVIFKSKMECLRYIDQINMMIGFGFLSMPQQKT